MTETNNNPFKMPADYNFSTRGKNWAEYYKDFVLRTDAVWEKEKLRDYFRLYMKCFYFDKASSRYHVFEPEDLYSVIFESCALEDIQPFMGYTPTGRTNSFQHHIGPRQRVAVTHQSHFSKQDYFDLCALRFDKWDRCDYIFHDERASKYDFVPDKNYKHYPCYREFYETQYACSDDLFDFLMELSHQKRANGITHYDVHSHEIQRFPNIYDSPKRPEKRTMTY